MRAGDAAGLTAESMPGTIDYWELAYVVWTPVRTPVQDWAIVAHLRVQHMCAYRRRLGFACGPAQAKMCTEPLRDS